jgi:hypothetical protein
MLDCSVAAEKPMLGSHDNIFPEMFVEEPKQYRNLRVLDKEIERYEQMSGFRLIIQKVFRICQHYRFRSHMNCCFRAKYGKVRGGDAITVKEAFTKLYHTTQPAPPTAKGRAYKKRMKGVIESGVNHVLMSKDKYHVPKDVMKASPSLS